MRLSSVLLPVAVFGLAAVLSLVGARAAVRVVEETSVDAVQAALVDEGQAWVSVLGDGLQIILEGEAPSEAVRFRSMTIAGTQVDASRVIDNMSVADNSGIAPPDFAIEILRNDSGISLIGLVPANTDRAAIVERLQDGAPGLPVTDLLETAEHPTPENWTSALDYAVEALDSLPRSQISVSPGLVEIMAMAESSEAKWRLETDLTRQRPEGMRLALDVIAPRPVITPFIVRFLLDADGRARFEACSADSEDALAEIATAATAAGFEGKVNCPIGLGVPSGTWAEAVAMSIGAVADLGGGRVTLSDADVTLVALEGTDPALFEQVAGELENALPDLFALEAVLPEPPEAAEAEVPEFTATLSPEGQVQLRGRVADDLMNATARNYAAARFGDADLTMGTRVTEGLPSGWSMRMLAAIEALSRLSSGSVVLTPDLMTVRGVTGNQRATADISQLLLDKLGQGAEFRVNVTYEESLDPIAALPTAEECIQQIMVVTESRKITFDPGSADIAGGAQAVVDDIAEILRRCADLRVEIAGYTDSQGREEMNERLSQDRAQAVLTALSQRRVPVSSFRAVGYGEDDPIADNATEDGREANRRIEFRLIDTAAEEEATGLEQIEAEAAAETAPDAGEVDEADE
ncbi:OmpA family protein [Roseisalinus antarcticus]|uniref:Putative lipoprotein YiaD n=1 Tax=Roseisalinus antarcticus TaxID=254357 RepID=A0A1Y5RS84_9RHOB|nr:OmpA family protein [Roseisalinus antarcticus]SLN21465.1 putative lipoprotein YiaD precursor [Roseisalinus antarcticus]